MAWPSTIAGVFFKNISQQKGCGPIVSAVIYRYALFSERPRLLAHRLDWSLVALVGVKENIKLTTNTFRFVGSGGSLLT